jgi:hypothetical protein
MFSYLENEDLEAIDWDLETLLLVLAGVPLVIPSSHDHHIIRKDDWNVTGRVRILVSLFHKFGVDETLLRFDEWCQRTL